MVILLYHSRIMTTSQLVQSCTVVVLLLVSATVHRVFQTPAFNYDCSFLTTILSPVIFYFSALYHLVYSHVRVAEPTPVERICCTASEISAILTSLGGGICDEEGKWIKEKVCQMSYYTGQGEIHFSTASLQAFRPTDYDPLLCMLFLSTSSSGRRKMMVRARLAWYK